MQFPTHITKEEMQQLLHQFRIDYLPKEEGTFIDTLDEEGLRFIFAMIGEKDEKIREDARNQLEQKIAENDKQKFFLVQNVMQKANRLMLQYREKGQQSKDMADVEALEKFLNS
ncbi:MAG: hypothetical protein LBG52_03650 [Candidatus Peribacteria bacterium]|jgi:ABC-type uncharacterized transport system ATPase subunit|nr:hypothetical protein [Candidatus Peribacteria bacterium]